MRYRAISYQVSMKTYVITLSQVFPVTHARAGEPTGFKDKFLAAIKKQLGERLKLHTIRANYELWKKRFDEIAEGKAQLSIRQWSGKPYRSKQVELAVLTKDDGIGIERLTFDKSRPVLLPNVNYKPVGVGNLANNDGLSLEDWEEWFKNYDLSQPLAVIHFTNFRYKDNGTERISEASHDDLHRE